MDRDKRQNGQGIIEYTFIIVLIAMVVLMVLVWFGPTIGNIFSGITAGL